ncbi:protein-disulfide reductase DsbD [Actinobacillus seminis]|uniref:protein-disulfide reductase DsbD n=1 Tax=Actinobacillus seminis TaxID=722 RepID=UPI003B951080
MKKYWLIVLVFFSVFVHAGWFNSQVPFLKAEDAFVFSAQQHVNSTTQEKSVNLHWDIAEGYYLYQKELRVVGTQTEIAPLSFPPAEEHQDEFFGRVLIYREQLDLPLSLRNANSNTQLEVIYQGCTTGFCYPPETKTLSLANLPIKTINDASINTQSAVKNFSVFNLSSTDPNSLTSALSESRFSALWFFVLGLGLAFTPCVLPMLPLLSAIVIGQGRRPNMARALGLSFTYVQGMALTYTLLGLVVAMIGLPFQVALQSPYVLIGLSVIFTLLALSMFGVFSIQLPGTWQTKLTLISQGQKGGVFSGVFVMGMVAGLIASPCTSAPLSATLLYVAQSGDLIFGALTLYLLALGMGGPLIFITLFGNKILPTSSAWTEKVKTAFGFVMLALPVFLLSRVLPEVWGARMWAMLGVAFCLWAALQIPAKGIAHALRISFFFAAFILVKPLQDWVWQDDAIQEAQNAVVFQKIRSEAELNQALMNNPKAVAMLDLYADWCVACKEFEKYTFNTPKVRSDFEHILLLQVDMTKNSAENAALMKKFQIVGLPSILFFNQQGEEIQGSRVSGFMDQAQFSAWIKEKVLR